MSYILDALKKAEHERQLGAVPHLHAPASVTALPVNTHTPRSIMALLVGLVLAVVILALLIWLRPWSSDSVYTLTIRTAKADLSGQPAPVAPALMRVAPPLRAPPVETASVQALPAAQPAKVPAPPAQVPAPPRPLPAPAVAPPQTAGESLAALRELPEKIQQQIPPLTVSGYIYADQPADRSVIINSKFIREGDPVAPDLVLEKLTPSGMILNFRGYRYRTSY
jgi:general secretion pathway protein B